MRKFARCMRSHEITGWPDPSFDSQGRLGFIGPGSDNPPGSPTDHAVQHCHHLLPPIVTALGPPHSEETSLAAGDTRGVALARLRGGGSPLAGGSATSRQRSPTQPASAPTACRTSPTRTAADRSPRPTRRALGVSSTQLQAAQQACQHLYPSNGRTLSASSLRQCYESGVCPQVLVQQAVNAGLKFARCMLHGRPGSAASAPPCSSAPSPVCSQPSAPPVSHPPRPCGASDQQSSPFRRPAGRCMSTTTSSDTVRRPHQPALHRPGPPCGHSTAQ